VFPESVNGMQRRSGYWRNRSFVIDQRMVFFDHVILVGVNSLYSCNFLLLTSPISPKAVSRAPLFLFLPLISLLLLPGEIMVFRYWSGVILMVCSCWSRKRGRGPRYMPECLLR